MCVCVCVGWFVFCGNIQADVSQDESGLPCGIIMRWVYSRISQPYVIIWPTEIMIKASKD